MNESAPIRNEVSVAGFDSGVRGVTPPSSRDGRNGVFLTELLVELGFADRAKIEAAEDAARNSGKTVEQLLLDAGTIDDRQLSLAVAERNGLDHVDLREFEVDMKAAECVSRSVAARSRAVPIAFANDGALIVAVQDTFDTLAVPRLETMTGKQVRPVVASVTAIRRLIERLPDEPAEPAPTPNVPRIKSQRELELTADKSPDEVGEPEPSIVEEAAPEPPIVEEPVPEPPIVEVGEPEPSIVEEAPPEPSIVEEAELAPEESNGEEPSHDRPPFFEGLSMDLDPTSMEPKEPEPVTTADAEEPDEEGGSENLLSRELRKTKEDVAKLEGRLKEAVTAAQDAIAANERLNAIRRAIDGKDSG
jgi:hypothetical protein